MNNSQGISGAIAFGEDTTQFVAAFFMEKSERSPFRRKESASNQGLTLLQTKISPTLRPLIYAALPLLTFDVEGVRTPLVSSAFWSGSPSEHSTSWEPWEDVYNNGASLVRTELLDEQAGLEVWAQDMELGSAEVELVAELYHRRITAGSAQMILTPAEADYLRRFARNTEGIRACARAFGDFGITFPVD